ncbi:hypothetical protein C8F04DRAFT_1299890 [Mycena alexandri]|uniref:Uncharacterized protein n=1 Tax=Mycena alexandri TaxID=1745969 RepID=A0AAD6SDJ0_9AGAR|nr:hypothetical protein C8F04DRAFT_1299890 [Mycena alexandri]
MPSPAPLRLQESEEYAIRSLHKTIRATRYEDPVDQDAFLVASARSVVASFAEFSDIGECVFTIRVALVANNLRLKTPPDAILGPITDFAGEIVRFRQTIRDRKNVQREQVCAEQGAAARAARREALESAARHELNKSAADTVSIPSDDEEPAEPPHPSPLRVKAMPPPSPVLVRLIALLSPLQELDAMMFSLRLSSPCAPPPSPWSQSRSLPDLVPIVKPQPHARGANGRGPRAPTMSGPTFVRGRNPTPKPLNGQMPTPLPTPTSNVAVLAPRPLNRGSRPRLNYVDDWLVSKPSSTGYRAHKRSLLGSFSRSKIPARKPKAKFVVSSLRSAFGLTSFAGDLNDASFVPQPPISSPTARCARSTK